ncbi:MAG: GTPase HflX [Endomicrobia bacterium]|nr:GTPase HflX [Endomicrobiia bacterium]
MERVIAIATILKNKTKEYLKRELQSLEELKNLITTAKGITQKVFIVKRENIDPAFYIGKGKAEEINKYVTENKINTAIFDNELTPAQIKNLETIINAKIIDRTRLILDIFAQRAHTKEAKLQVELAQLQYLLPRLTKKGIYMDNQVGGIGTRGPGETKLEYDRRKIMTRIEKIKSDLEKVVLSRQEQKKLRIESQIPIVALVGYTNTGKSTLFNSLLKRQHAYADDKLFATLDPLTRRLKLPNDINILIVDTVGFIDKLPHNLVESFKSTLEIVKDASLLLEVIDITNINMNETEKLVNNILEELNASNIPKIKVYNKIDLLNENTKQLVLKKLNDKNTVFISAKNMMNLDILLEKIQSILEMKNIIKTIRVSINDYETINFIYKHCKVIFNNIKNNFIYLKILADKKIYETIKNMIRK